MGGLLGLCSADGGPCGGGLDTDDRGTNRHADIERQKLINNHDSDTTSSEQSISIESTSTKGKSVQLLTHNSPTREPSKIYNVPTKKIPIAPMIANHILPNETFIAIRKQMEQKAQQLNDIEKIVFQNDCWLIQGSDAIALEEHRDLFDIIIWRVPIIPAFAHFTNEQEIYAKLTQQNDKLNLNTHGIWSLLSKEKFIEMFDAKLLDDIDIINDKQHNYLADSRKFPSQSGEYKELIDKLSVIEVMKKANEIIIIGQKTCVLDLLRIIRQSEVKHRSMMGMFKTRGSSLGDWEIKCDDPHAPDPKYITSYYCIVSNLPLQCTQPELQEYLNAHSRWTIITIMEDNINNENENENENDEKQEMFVLKDRSAKIEFDTNEALQTFMDDIEGTDGVYFDGHKVCLEKHDKELKKRKRRRLYAGHMIV